MPPANEKYNDIIVNLYVNQFVVVYNYAMAFTVPSLPPYTSYFRPSPMQRVCMLFEALKYP